MTVQKIAWIVGTITGAMWESEEAWSKKVMGKDRIRRVYRARSLVMLALHEVCGASYVEIAKVVGNRHTSVIGRSIAQGRKWKGESKANMAAWARIVESISESTAAEQQHHAQAAHIKVSVGK